MVLLYTTSKWCNKCQTNTHTEFYEKNGQVVKVCVCCKEDVSFSESADSY